MVLDDLRLLGSRDADLQIQKTNYKVILGFLTAQRIGTPDPVLFNSPLDMSSVFRLQNNVYL